MEKKKTKILVCCHKPDVKADKDPFMPIHVGKSTSVYDLGIVGDDEGDNISNKNFCYCELTGLYWAWKNLKDVDIVGLCHYRRYFDFANQCRSGFPTTTFKPDDFGNIDLSVPEEFLEKLTPGTVVMAYPNTFGHTLHLDYCANLVSDDFHTMRLAIKETQPVKYQEAFHEVMYRGNIFSPCNMFIMCWKDFDKYCTWLFGLLETIESRTDITHYNPVQRRIYGYMGEYLLNVYAEAEEMKKIYRPVIWFSDADDPWKGVSSFKYKIRCMINNLAVWLMKERSSVFHLNR